MTDNEDRVDLNWLEENPDRVKAIKGYDPRKPDEWTWCWRGPDGLLYHGSNNEWIEAFTLRSAIAAAMECV